MKARYDRDIDLLEVMETGHRSVGHVITDALTVFKDERSGGVVGFMLEGASETYRDLRFVSIQFRLVGLIRLIRGLFDMTQEEFAKLIDRDLKLIARIERGELFIRTSFENIVRIAEIAPKGIDMSILLYKEEDSDRPRV